MRRSRRLGTARLGSARSNTAEHGTAHTDEARNGTARLGSTPHDTAAPPPHTTLAPGELRPRGAGGAPAQAAALPSGAATEQLRGGRPMAAPRGGGGPAGAARWRLREAPGGALPARGSLPAGFSTAGGKRPFVSVSPRLPRPAGTPSAEPCGSRRGVPVPVGPVFCSEPHRSGTFRAFHRLEMCAGNGWVGAEKR